MNKDISHVHYPKTEGVKIIGKSGQATLRDSSEPLDDAMKAQYISQDYESQNQTFSKPQQVLKTEQSSRS